MASGTLAKAGRENWQRDDSGMHCSRCSAGFSCARRKHHCRACGKIFCAACSSKRISYTPRTRRNEKGYTEKTKRVCERCFARISDVRKNAEGAKAGGLVLRNGIRDSVRVSLDQIAKFQARLHEERGEVVELDEAIQFYRDRKVQAPAEEDDRSAEFHEWCQACSFDEELPEDLRQFVYHDRTADILVYSWGSTKADAFAQMSMGLLQYMAELLRRAASEATCEELEEFLFIFNYEVHTSRDVEVAEIDEDALGVEGRGRGEKWAATADEASAETQARTRHMMGKAGRQRREEVEKELSHGATGELAGKLRRWQDTVVYEKGGPAREEKSGGHGRGGARPAMLHDHTSHIVLHCWGKTRASAFAQLCAGTFHYMTKFDAVQGSPGVGGAAGHDLVDRLHRLLHEFLSVFRIEALSISPSEALLDGDAAAARTRAQEAARQGEDEAKTRLMSGASSELSYALKKRLYAVAGGEEDAAAAARSPAAKEGKEEEGDAVKQQRQQQQAVAARGMAEAAQHRRKQQQPQQQEDSRTPEKLSRAEAAAHAARRDAVADQKRKKRQPQ